MSGLGQYTATVSVLLALLLMKAGQVTGEPQLLPGSMAYELLSVLFAPMPPLARKPPVVRVTGSLQRPTFRVHKLLIESRPGFWISSACFVPNTLPKTGAPGVLFLSGHTPDGFRSNVTSEDDYQIVQLNLVARGFVVLSIDPIGQGERFQYPDAGPELQAPTTQHEYLGRQLLLNGVNAMSFWLWDEMVAMDYLASLPYVDDNFLGAAGCSGGGTQTAYVGAMDPRVAAASMACYMSTFQIDRSWAPGGRGDGEQTWPHGVSAGLDKPDLLEVRAPKPTQVLITTDDTCFPAQGGRDALTEARNAFVALGSGPGSNLSSIEAIWHHGYMQQTRTAVYAFMCTQLGLGRTNANCSLSGELAIPEFTDRELYVTNTGQVQTDPTVMSRSVHDFTLAMTESNVERLAQQRSANETAFLVAVAAQAPTLIGFRAPDTVISAFAPWFLGSEAWVASNVSCRVKHVLAGEGECLVVITANYPVHSCSVVNPCPAIMLLDMQRTSSSSITPLVEQLTAVAFVVLEVDLCGLGEVGPAFSSDQDAVDYQPCEDLAVETGRSIPGIHAADILRAATFVIDSIPAVGKISATVVFDQLHTAALHAALLTGDSKLGSLVLVQPMATLASAALGRFYAPNYFFSWVYGLLKHYDLPDVMAALAASQQRILVLGPVDQLMGLLPSTQCQANFVFPASVFASRGRAADFRVVPEWSPAENNLAKYILDWSGQRVPTADSKT